MKTVSLADALRSGKKFRRKLSNGSYSEWQIPGLFSYSISREGILSNDWELEESPREIWVWDFGDRLSTDTFESPLSASFAYKTHHDGRPVKFREVLDE